MRAAEVLSQIREVADRQPQQVFRTVDRLIVGPTALKLLGEAAGWRSTQRPGEQLTIFGIPVVPDGAFYRRWMLLDRVNGIIAEGVIDAP